MSATKEFLWIAPKEGLLLASMFGINDVVNELAERGGTRVASLTSLIP
jgi:hypothetical protein